MSYGVRVGYRLVIAGCELEAVTDPSMEGASTDGRQRVRGLKQNGLRLQDSATLATAAIKSKGIKFEIVDRQLDQAWAQALTRLPTLSTELLEEIPVSGATTRGVSSSGGFEVGDYVYVGTECLEVTAIPSATSLSFARAQRDTIAQRHPVSNYGRDLVFPEVMRAYPRSMEGRRVYLYRYVLGQDSLTGDGTLIWRGVVTSDVSLNSDNATWTIGAGPITEMWGADLGAVIDEEFSIAGIFYSGANPFRLTIDEIDVDGVPDDFGEASFSTRVAEVTIVGYFERQEDFVAELNTQLAASLTSIGAMVNWDTAPIATIEGERWGIAFTTGATPRWLNIRTYEGAQLIDGDVRPEQSWAEDRLSRGLGPAAGTAYTYLAGNVDGSLTGRATTPRATWGLSPDRDGFGGAASTYPNCIYYQGSRLVQIDPANEVQVTLKWPTIQADRAGQEEVQVSIRDDNFSTTRPRYFETIQSNGTPVGWFPGNEPTMQVRLELTTGLEGFGDLGALRDRLVELGPREANAGNAPFIVAGDLADWSAVVDAATNGRPRRSFFTRRRLVQSQTLEVEEILREEAKLVGCFYRINATGQVELRPLRPQDPKPVATLDASHVIPETDPPRWRRAPFGFFTEGTLKTGYSYVDDEHTGAEFTIRSRNAISSRKLPKELEIAPYSAALEEPLGEGDSEVAAAVFGPIFSVLGQPYAVLSIAIPSVRNGVDLLAACLVGEVVRVINHRLPSPQGLRGVDVEGMIISRDWDLRRDVGVLDVLVSEAPTAGYTPSARIASVVSGAGTTSQVWACDYLDPILGTIELAPAGTVLSDHYLAGYRIEAIEADATTQTPRAGTITAVDDDAGTIAVTLDSAATIASSSYVRFVDAGDPALAVGQQAYAYWGDSTGRVSFVGGDEIAKRLA